MAIKSDGFPKRDNGKKDMIEIVDWYGDEMTITDRELFGADDTDIPSDVIGGIVSNAHITATDAARIIEVLQYMINKDRD